MHLHRVPAYVLIQMYAVPTGTQHLIHTDDEISVKGTQQPHVRNQPYGPSFLSLPRWSPGLAVHHLRTALPASQLPAAMQMIRII